MLPSFSGMVCCVAGFYSFFFLRRMGKNAGGAGCVTLFLFIFSEGGGSNWLLPFSGLFVVLACFSKLLFFFFFGEWGRGKWRREEGDGSHFFFSYFGRVAVMNASFLFRWASLSCCFSDFTGVFFFGEWDRGERGRGGGGGG